MNDGTGFGVHISFVRSITMDKWSEDQLKKMRVGLVLHCRRDICSCPAQLGGNEAFKAFIESYGSQGGYTKSMGMSEKYNSWACTQYREKVRSGISSQPYSSAVSAFCNCGS